MRIRNKNIKTRKKRTFNKKIPQNKVNKNTVNKNAVKKNTTKRRRRGTKKRKITKGGVKRKERDGECAICLEDFNEEDNPNIITLNCGHSFHRNCIINTCRHMQGACTCPLCRQPLTPEDLNELGIMPPEPLLPLPPYLHTMDAFREYINDKLREPTRTPLDKLDIVLSQFIGTDRLPTELYEEVAMEFELQQAGPAAYHKYRFIRIIDLADVPAAENRLNKKYFRYIDYSEAGHADELHDPEDALITIYDVFEV